MPRSPCPAPLHTPPHFRDRSLGGLAENLRQGIRRDRLEQRRARRGEDEDGEKLAPPLGQDLVQQVPGHEGDDKAGHPVDEAPQRPSKIAHVRFHCLTRVDQHGNPQGVGSWRHAENFPLDALLTHDEVTHRESCHGRASFVDDAGVNDALLRLCKCQGGMNKCNDQDRHRDTVENRHVSLHSAVSRANQPCLYRRPELHLRFQFYAGMAERAKFLSWLQLV